MAGSELRCCFVGGLQHLVRLCAIFNFSVFSASSTGARTQTLCIMISHSQIRLFEIPKEYTFHRMRVQEIHLLLLTIFQVGRHSAITIVRGNTSYTCMEESGPINSPEASQTCHNRLPRLLQVPPLSYLRPQTALRLRHESLEITL